MALHCSAALSKGKERIKEIRPLKCCGCCCVLCVPNMRALSTLDLWQMLSKVLMLDLLRAHWNEITTSRRHTESAFLRGKKRWFDLRVCWNYYLTWAHNTNNPATSSGQITSKLRATEEELNKEFEWANVSHDRFTEVQASDICVLASVQVKSPSLRQQSACEEFLLKCRGNIDQRGDQPALGVVAHELSSSGSLFCSRRQQAAFLDTCVWLLIF